MIESAWRLLMAWSWFGARAFAAKCVTHVDRECPNVINITILFAQQEYWRDIEFISIFEWTIVGVFRYKRLVKIGISYVFNYSNTETTASRPLHFTLASPLPRMVLFSLRNGRILVIIGLGNDLSLTCTYLSKLTLDISRSPIENQWGSWKYPG